MFYEYCYSIKLFRSNIKVTKEIKEEIRKSFINLNQKFLIVLLDNLEILNDIPEIKIKLAPIIWAKNNPKPVVKYKRSMWPKKPISQKK